MLLEYSICHSTGWNKSRLAFTNKSDNRLNSQWQQLEWREWELLDPDGWLEMGTSFLEGKLTILGEEDEIILSLETESLLSSEASQKVGPVAT